MAANSSVPLSALPAVQPTLYEGRVSKITFEALIGIFYGLAIIGALVRFMLQIRIHRRLYLDDYFLVFACVCLTAGTVLGYANVGNLYWDETLTFNHAEIVNLLAEHVDVAAHIKAYQRLYYSYPAVLWTAIFAVKFAYLSFFRRLIDRIRPLVIYWRFVVGIAVVSLPICIISIYVACMKWGLAAASCLEPVYFHRSLGLAIFDIVLDVGTDLLLVSIPIRLLWFARIRLRQKVILGVFLSLNLFMAITAAVRVSGLKFRGEFDEVWLFLWQQIEACIAVAMISLTAFRSVFISSESSRAEKERAKKAWYSSTLDAIKRSKDKRRNDEEANRELPTIPSATLTGMRTFIRGGHHTRTGSQLTNLTPAFKGEPDEWPLYKNRHGSTHTAGEGSTDNT